jgi:hypothetical protein
MSPSGAALATVPAAESAPGGPGGIQSLPLRPLETGARSGGSADLPEGAMGLPPRKVEPFALAGIVWTDAEAQLAGVAQIRTRSRATGEWSGWQELHDSHEHGPEPETAERQAGELRGATDPLWVGDSDGVQARVLPADPDLDLEVEVEVEVEVEAEVSGLPEGMRLDLVNPDGGPAGTDEEEGEEEEEGAEERDGQRSPRRGAVQRLDQDPVYEELEQEYEDQEQEQELEDQELELAASRPSIVSRAGWGANENWREPGFAYTRVVKTVFVHHTAGSNNYSCSQAPSLIRGIYQYHTQSQGWRDIGYNFLVDKCGTIYEGRAGGVQKAVQGAHTYGFNHNSMGVAVIGSHGGTSPSTDAKAALARLGAWKLGLDGRSPTGTWKRMSAGGKYAKGTVIRMHNISGHRDGFVTECPGDRLYGQLPNIRTTAGRL